MNRIALGRQYEVLPRSLGTLNSEVAGSHISTPACLVYQCADSRAAKCCLAKCGFTTTCFNDLAHFVSKTSRNKGFESSLAPILKKSAVGNNHKHLCDRCHGQDAMWMLQTQTNVCWWKCLLWVWCLPDCQVCPCFHHSISLQQWKTEIKKLEGLNVQF